MRRINDYVTYTRTVSDDYYSTAICKNEIFLSGENGPWLITGGYRALDMAGPLWFDIPRVIEDSVHKMGENADFGELIVYKRVLFIQTDLSEYYKSNRPTDNRPTDRLEKKRIWRDYYFAAFYAAVQYILSERGSTIILNNPATGVVWPRWMWGLFCEASFLLAKSEGSNISISDLADLPYYDLEDCGDFYETSLSPISTKKNVNESTGATHIKFWPRKAQLGPRD